MANKKALTDDEIDIIRRMAAWNMNVSAVGKNLFISRTATVYRLNRIKKKTGRDPRRFYDLVELLEMAEEADNG